MPFGLGSNKGGSPDYRDLERAPLPLSAADDPDDDLANLPPYSDAPPPSSSRRRSVDNGHDDDDEDEHGDVRTNGGRLNGGLNGGSNGEKKSGRKAVAIRDGNSESRSLSRSDAYGSSGYEEDDEDDGDYYRGNATPSKSLRRPKYRGGLVCAYLRHWLSCACVDCCGGSSAASRNIGGGPARKCCRRANRAVMVIFYVLIVVTIALCAGAIGYIIAQDGSPFKPDEVDEAALASNSDSSSGSVTSGGGGDELLKISKDLPPPPSNLHDICSDWITDTGRENCQAYCDNAKCCQLSAMEKGSCWVGHAQDCATYRAACMALELHGSSWGGDGKQPAGSGAAQNAVISASEKVKLESPKPSYLDQVCSVGSLATPAGFDLCSDVCRPSRCCFPDRFGCTLEEGTERWCPSYEGPCAAVEESWRGSGHAVAAGSSGGGNGSGTGGASQQQQQQSVAAQVMQVCNAANLNPPDACIEACHPGACCYVSSEYPPIARLFDEHYGRSSSPMQTVQSCATNVGFCQQYGSCEHLNHLKDVSGWHSDDVTYELDIAGVCKAEYVAQFGALECSNVCQPAHCCFSGEYECDDVDFGAGSCGEYEACGVLYPNYVAGSPSPPAPAVPAAPAAPTSKLFELAKRIDETCDEDSIGSASGRAQCQLLCKERLCCFDKGGEY